MQAGPSSRSDVRGAFKHSHGEVGRPGRAEGCPAVLQGQQSRNPHVHCDSAAQLPGIPPGF